jgi:sugar diacid utilization regulator
MTQVELVRVQELREPLPQQACELQLITTISQLIGQGQPLRVILDCVAHHVANLIRVPFCAILLSRSSDERLSIEGSYGLNPDYITCINRYGLQPTDTARLPSGEVLRTGKPKIWGNLQSEPSMVLFHEAQRRQGVVSMLVVPLSGPEGIIGTLNCYHSTAQHFCSYDMEQLTTIAAYAAIAIHNATLVERLNGSINQLSSLNAIIKQQHEILLRSETIHRQFTALALEERGLDSITTTLAELLGCGVMLYDQRLTLIASGTGQPTPAPLSPDVLAHGNLRQGRPLLLKHGGYASQPILISPIVAGSTVQGYLVLPALPRLQGELEQRAIEHAATVCALELVKQRNTLEMERRVRGTFISDLLTGRFGSEEEIRRHASLLGYALPERYRVLVADVDQLERHVERQRLNQSQVAELTAHLADVLEQSVRQAYPRALVAHRNERAIILLPQPRSTSPCQVAALTAQLQADVQHCSGGLTISVGVSSQLGRISHFSRGYQESLDAMQIARRFGQQASLSHFDDLGIYRLMLQGENHADLVRFAHNLLDPLMMQERARAADLVQTLETYLHHGLSAQQTATALFVHPNTVKHRLLRIAELTGLDVQNMRCLLELQLALLVRKLAGPGFDTGSGAVQQLEPGPAC